MMKFILLFLCIAINSTYGIAQDYVLRLKSGQIHTSMNIHTFKPGQEQITQHAINGRYYLMVQFEQTPNDAAKKAIITATGAEFIDYIPDYAYVLSVPVQTQPSDFAAFQARYAAFINPVWKLAPELTNPSKFPDYATKEPGRLSVNIVIYANLDPKQIQMAFNQLPGMRLEHQEYTHTFTGSIAVENLADVAALPYVQWIEAGGREIIPYNYRGVSNHRVRPLWANLGRNLKGEGVVVGVGDGGFVAPHLDFQNRLTNLTTSVLSGFGDHGDHVAGTVGGAGVINPLWTGMAPKSSIITHQTSTIVNNAPTYFNNFGMVLTNNSYGFAINCPTSGTYGNYSSTSRNIDIQLRQFPKILHCFAASNDGAVSPCGSHTGGFGTISDGFGQAKNALVVGAATENDGIASFSSRGPAHDGRVKPEVMGVGTAVTSTIPTNTYGTKQGTSMATPGVTGSLALLYERFKQLNGGQNPDAALIKAIVCNTADDLGNPNVDYRFGYGRINMLRAVTAIEQGRYFSGTVSHGNTVDYTLTVPAGMHQVRVALYWHDVEGSVLANPALVNNLNLQLIDPSNNTWNPWVLDPTPANTNNNAVRGVDNLNNIEQVTLTNPAAGVYTIRVSGANVPQGPQAFYVTWENLAPQIHLAHPNGEEFFSPGTTQVIEWNAYGLSGGTFTIQYSTDGGNTWLNIATGVSINDRRRNWTVPNVATNQARVRILQVGAQNLFDDSDFNFTIFGTPTVTATPCDRHIYLSWPAVANAAYYEVQRYDGSDFITITNTTSTSIGFPFLENGVRYWHAVTAVHADGFKSQRSTAVSAIPTTASACPIANDIGIYTITSPTDGRHLTSTQLSASSVVNFRIKNYGNNNVSLVNTPVFYSINGGAPQAASVTQDINANTLAVAIPFPATADLSNPGNYQFRVWTDWPSDNFRANDTLRLTIRHLPNAPVTLPIVENLETAEAATYLNSAFGLRGIERFDFTGSNIASRLRTNFLPRLEGANGNRTITLDRSASGTNVTNQLIYTINMSNYAAENLIYLDFDFMHHGEDAGVNERVWVRGNDSQAWVQAYDLGANQGVAGTVNKVRALNLKTALGAQPVGTSFQIRFGNECNNEALTTTTLRGYTFDNIKVSVGGSDVQLVQVNSPVGNCFAPGNANVSVRVRNNSGNNLSNVPIFYSVNEGAPVSANIPTLNAGQTIDFTFPGQVNLSGSPRFVFTFWVKWNGPTPAPDFYADNDSIKNHVVVPTVNTFPYLETFENGPAGWTAGGTNSSWALGFPGPSKNVIRGTGSGVNCWVTNLNGLYNNSENSWVQSPCFNLAAAFSNNAMLSFNMALNSETDWDFVWVEYTTNNGTSWTKLGAVNTPGSVHWYNRAANNTWEGTAVPWRVVTCPIPAAAITANTRFRIRFTSDASIAWEGVAFDDFHIYGSVPIHNVAGNTLNRTASSTGSGNWVYINNASGHRIFGFRDNQNLGTVTANVQIHTGAVRNHGLNMYLNRNLYINTTNAATQPVTVQFFIRHAELEALMAADAGVRTFHHMGLYKYSGVNENFTPADNVVTVGSSQFIKPLQYIPYMDGYIVQTSINGFSEFYFTQSDFTPEEPLPLQHLSLQIHKTKEGNKLQWRGQSTSPLMAYRVLRSFNGQNYSMIYTGEFTQHEPAFFKNFEMQYLDSYGTQLSKWQPCYYQVEIQDFAGKWRASNVVLADGLDALQDIKLHPNPARGATYITFDGPDKPAVLQYAILDVSGRVVSKADVENMTGNSLMIDTRALKPGYYLLKISSQNLEQAIPFIVK